MFGLGKAAPIPCVVLLPTLNSARYLGEAIQSILDQTFADFHLYILDGGSKDATIDVAKSYARTDRRITVKVFPNVHPAERVDRTIMKADCDFIALQHSDDISYAHRLEKQIKFLSDDPSVAVCSGRSRAFWHLRGAESAYEGITVHSRPLTHSQIEAEILFWYVMHCPTLMLRGASIKKAELRFSNEFNFCNDWWVTVRNIKKLRYANIDAELSAYRMHLASDGPIHLEQLRKEEERLREKTLEFFGFKATPRQLELHKKIRVFPDKQLPVAPDEFAEVCGWLDELLLQNKQIRACDPDALTDVVARLKGGIRALACEQGHEVSW